MVCVSALVCFVCFEFGWLLVWLVFRLLLPVVLRFSLGFDVDVGWLLLVCGFWVCMFHGVGCVV